MATGNFLGFAQRHFAYLACMYTAYVLERGKFHQIECVSNHRKPKPAEPLPAASVPARFATPCVALSFSPQTFGLLFAYGRVPQRRLVVGW